MPGYLDQYGAGEERRNQIIIRIVVTALAVVILGGLSWYLLKNHHQESVVKTFVRDVRRGDYHAAYNAWGCTAQRPCSGYDYNKFMQDWGPGASGPDAAVVGVTDSESCNNGVLLTVDVNRARQEKLWVDKDNDAISFAPFPVCPHKNPWAIMIHRTIGRLRKPLLR